MGSLNLLIDCTYLKIFRQAVAIKLPELVSPKAKKDDENKKKNLQVPEQCDLHQLRNVNMQRRTQRLDHPRKEREWSHEDEGFRRPLRFLMKERQLP